MPITPLKTPKFRPPKELVANWQTWRKGWNIFLRDNEIDKKEMSKAENLILTGSGIPTKRWGTSLLFNSGPSITDASTNMILPIKSNTNNQEILTLGSWGYLTKKSGTSYTKISGVSWPSNAVVNGTQLGNNAYFVSEDREFAKYDFSTAVGFSTIAKPSGVFVTNTSLPSLQGETEYEWRVTAISNSGGETLGSTPVSLTSLPQDLTTASIRLSWDPVSGASGVVAGYNIYRAVAGQNHRWVGGTAANTTYFDDPGYPPSSTQLVPLSNSTGGYKAKYILRFKDRLVLAGLTDSPTKVLLSAPYPNQERFDVYAGGAYIEIEPDSGEAITGLGIYQEKLIIFKEHSVWQVAISTIPIEGAEIGEATALSYQLLTGSQGCSSFRSITPVENEIMFNNRNGVYILRYEPQLLTVLNANEISAKIKPYFDSLSDYDKINSVGGYVDKKYWLYFPRKKEAIMFDRERLAFMGPMKYPWKINDFASWIDADGTSVWGLANGESNEVLETKDNFTTDNGSAIQTYFKSRKEDFGDWTTFKILNEVYTNFSSVTGNVEVNVYIEERSGRTITVKSFTVSGTAASGTSGMGTDIMGLIPLGSTSGTPTISDDELPTKSFIYKSTRTFQVEIRTFGVNDNYKLLGILGSVTFQPRGNSPAAWRK